MEPTDQQKSGLLMMGLVVGCLATFVIFGPLGLLALVIGELTSLLVMYLAAKFTGFWN